MSFFLKYKININAINVTFNPIKISTQQSISTVKINPEAHEIVHKCTWSSANFDMGVLMKALSTTWVNLWICNYLSM